MKNAIHRQVEQGVQFEREHHLLERALPAHLDDVGRLIDLSKGDASKRIIDFVVHYVQSVPNLIGALEAAAERANLTTYIQQIIDLSYSLFLTPTKNFGVPSGLTTVMVKSYLVHRLLEEINETCLFHAGQPLIPIDSTLANLIVHTLIGESFANDLDQVVNDAVEQFNSPKTYQSDGFTTFVKMHSNNLVHILQKLPSVLDSTDFEFSNKNRA